MACPPPQLCRILPSPWLVASPCMHSLAWHRQQPFDAYAPCSLPCTTGTPDVVRPSVQQAMREVRTPRFVLSCRAANLGFPALVAWSAINADCSCWLPPECRRGRSLMRSGCARQRRCGAAVAGTRAC